MHLITNFSLICLVVFISGCASFSHFNTECKQVGDKCQPIDTKASFYMGKDKGIGKPDTLVILSLSGGGSRAAYFSAETMFKLQDIFKGEKEKLDLLKEVDVISSVSGGSLPAAYYAISKDKNDKTEQVPSNRYWKYETVMKLMSKDYRERWFWNFFWPTNIAKYWFTAFDRSDVMAQTFADNMFDVRYTGQDLTFGEINPNRPNLVLNATNGTTDQFGLPFTFTKEEFEKLDSDINEYEIARGVMASASFPAVFNYMTLGNFKCAKETKSSKCRLEKAPSPNSYVHVFDGGNSDNLGLNSVVEIIDKNKEDYDKIVVILVDSYTKSKGVSPSDYDGRKLMDYGVDLNFLDSVDSLLSNNRQQAIEKLRDELKGLDNSYRFVFYHVKFDDVMDDGLKEDLNSIRTDFKIKSKSCCAIKKAVGELIVPNNRCLRKIKTMLLYSSKELTPLDEYRDVDCIWSSSSEKESIILPESSLCKRSRPSEEACWEKWNKQLFSK
uniref:Predicted acylesterase/phospholipase RssA, contains patatin domain n=1 Tax=Candidatus Kentrum sp. LFY TaxID=2126342 RepID=A0A450V5D1_9GAMM|nr:MAG: Predicted acylesterase/phospholipase RssA, contains patatin domain [Candidatus Kentron sp. LFY]